MSLLAEFKRRANFAFFIAELESNALDCAGDSFGRGVTRRIATGEGYQRKAGGIDEKDFLDLKAMRFFEKDVLVSATGEKRLEVPAKPVKRTRCLKRAGTRCIFCECAAYRRTQHRLKVGIDAVFSSVNSLADGVFHDGTESFPQIVIGEIRFSGSGRLR